MWAQVRGIPESEGKTVNFTRHSIPAVATTGLTEAVTPSGVAVSGVTVSATLVEYGAYSQISNLYSRTSVDVKLKEQVDCYGQHSGETIDTIIRDSMRDGITAQFASGSATTNNLSNLVATDVLNSAQCRRAVRTLKKNNALKFDGAQGNLVYGGLISPETSYDLLGDTTWVGLQSYSLPKGLQYGILGTYHGIEFVESTNMYVKAAAASNTLYLTDIMGKESLGVVSLDSKKVTGETNARLYIKEPGPNDTSNPINLYSTIGWMAELAPKVLNSLWIVEIYTGATA